MTAQREFITHALSIAFSLIMTMHPDHRFPRTRLVRLVRVIATAREKDVVNKSEWMTSMLEFYIYIYTYECLVYSSIDCLAKHECWSLEKKGSSFFTIFGRSLGTKGKLLTDLSTRFCMNGRDWHEWKYSRKSPEFNNFSRIIIYIQIHIIYIFLPIRIYYSSIGKFFEIPNPLIRIDN